MQQLHFAELPPQRHKELLARMAFLVMRGSLPDRAYHAANDGRVRDEEEDEDAHGIDWDVVKQVADAWPDPARGPDARPTHGVFTLARTLVGMVEATVEIPETHESNREQLSDLCLTPRMRRLVLALFDEELRRRTPEPPEPSDADSDGGEDGGEGRPHDDDEPIWDPLHDSSWP